MSDEARKINDFVNNNNPGSVKPYLLERQVLRRVESMNWEDFRKLRKRFKGRRYDFPGDLTTIVFNMTPKQLDTATQIEDDIEMAIYCITKRK